MGTPFQVVAMSSIKSLLFKQSGYVCFFFKTDVTSIISSNICSTNLSLPYAYKSYSGTLSCVKGQFIHLLHDLQDTPITIKDFLLFTAAVITMKYEQTTEAVFSYPNTSHHLAQDSKSSSHLETIYYFFPIFPHCCDHAEREIARGGTSYLDAFFQVHFFKLMAVLGTKRRPNTQTKCKDQTANINTNTIKTVLFKNEGFSPRNIITGRKVCCFFTSSTKCSKGNLAISLI